MEIIVKSIIILAIILGSVQCKSINWDAQLQRNSEQEIKLINSFSSLKKKTIIDKKAFSYACSYAEDIELGKGEIPDFSEFKHSQVIIENKNGAKRLFSNMFFEDGEIKDLPDENCMFDWFEYLSINKLPKDVIIDIPYLSDLKVTKEDKKMRLTYLFKPSKQQKKEGYTNFAIKSNWISLE